jgi:hypothetical protein
MCVGVGVWVWVCVIGFHPQVPSVYTPKLSEATDAWQVGVTMWEVLKYGMPPYGTDISIVAALERRVNGGGGLMCPPGTHHAVSAVVASCMSFEPSERPTMGTVENALAQLLSGPEKVRAHTFSCVTPFVSFTPPPPHTHTHTRTHATHYHHHHH